jgi:hypothetical protein
MLCHKCVSGHYRKYPSTLCSSHPRQKPDIDLPEHEIDRYNKELTQFHESEKCFMAQLLAGDAACEEVDDYIEAWHSSDSSYDLYVYLGFSEHEYNDFVSGKTTAQDIKDFRLKYQPYPIKKQAAS